jgi:E3 ubiquitin-protein ligase SHPRH
VLPPRVVAAMESGRLGGECGAQGQGAEQGPGPGAEQEWGQEQQQGAQEQDAVEAEERPPQGEGDGQLPPTPHQQRQQLWEPEGAAAEEAEDGGPRIADAGMVGDRKQVGPSEPPLGERQTERQTEQQQQVPASDPDRDPLRELHELHRRRWERWRLQEDAEVAEGESGDTGTAGESVAAGGDPMLVGSRGGSAGAGDPSGEGEMGGGGVSAAGGRGGSPPRLEGPRRAVAVLAASLDRPLAPHEARKLLGPLLKLRQACCHPQVGGLGGGRCMWARGSSAPRKSSWEGCRRPSPPFASATREPAALGFR